jgi:hypothetical protein
VGKLGSVSLRFCEPPFFDAGPERCGLGCPHLDITNYHWNEQQIFHLFNATGVLTSPPTFMRVLSMTAEDANRPLVFISSRRCGSFSSLRIYFLQTLGFDRA